MESDPVERLEELIAQCLPACAAWCPGEDPPEFAPPKVAITAAEAQGFLRAIDNKLFELEPDGQCRPVGLRQGYYCYELLFTPDKNKNRVVLWREWLTHAAAVASLHLDYGYPCDDIALDVDAFDILVYSRSNQPLIAVEAKKTEKELDAMLAGMKDIEATGLELKCNEKPLSNTEKKFRGLLAIRPEFFVAIAPGVERHYKVRYGVDRIPKTAELVPIERIPAAAS